MFLNDGNICIESFKVRLLALLGVDCRIEVVVNGLPRTGAVGERIPQEVGTGEIGRSAPASKIDLLVPPCLAFADLSIECDCHIASSA